jgi:hypothetical protein
LTFTFIGSTGDTNQNCDEFVQHGKNRGSLTAEELEILKTKKDAGTLTSLEKQKLKKDEKNIGERPSRQSKDKKNKNNFYDETRSYK